MTAQDDAVLLLAGDRDAAVWSAPGRVNLIGEHTDYNNGFVLPFAIDRRTVVAAARRDDGIIEVRSTFAPDPVAVRIGDLADLFSGDPGAAVHDGRVPEWAAYPLGVAWAALTTTNALETDLTGVSLAFASEVPVGAGLSSSAAIEGATAAALRDLWALDIDDLDIARIGRIAENDAVGAPTGIMDQVSSTLGQVDAAILLDCRSLETDIVPLGLEGEGLEVLVIDTRVAHAHSTGGYRARRESCERACAVLGIESLRDLAVDDLAGVSGRLDDETFRRVRHVVTESQRVLDTASALRDNGARSIGELLVASHESLRDDFEVSVPELDLAVASAIDAGAIGARMTGGGFGGSAIAVVAKDEVHAVAEAVASAFAAARYDTPHAFVVEPAHGVRRDR